MMSIINFSVYEGISVLLNIKEGNGSVGGGWKLGKELVSLSTKEKYNYI